MKPRFLKFAPQTWNALTISIRNSDSLCKFHLRCIIDVVLYKCLLQAGNVIFGRKYEHIVLAQGLTYTPLLIFIHEVCHNANSKRGDGRSHCHSLILGKNYDVMHKY